MTDNDFFNDLPAADNLPLVSFPQAVIAPDVDPDDLIEEQIITVQYNAAWQPVVASALSQLMLPSTWLGTDGERILALNRADVLKNLLTGGGPEVPQTQLRLDPENPCILQLSYDFGETWVNLVNICDLIEDIAVVAAT